MQYQKICKIHGELIQENIIVEPNRSAKRGYTLRCRICKKLNDKKWSSINSDYKTEKAIKWKNENREYYNAWAREDRKKNPEKYKKYEDNYIEKHGRIKMRKMEVARIHGITIEQYDSLFEQQNNECKICGLEETRKSKTDGIASLCVDHCHECRDNDLLGLLNIRGLLCHECNKGLGGFKDNVDLLKSAISYLEQHKHVE